MTAPIHLREEGLEGPSRHCDQSATSEPPIGNALSWPDAGCCWPDYPGGCACPPMERALRAWSRNDPFVAPMTAAQREHCLSEIASVEGYDAAEFEGSPDDDVARGVLNAWRDYCRDKGLL